MANKKIKVEDRMSSEQKLVNTISNFISVNKKNILIGVVALVVVIIAIVAISASKTNSSEDAMIRVSQYQDQIEEIVSSGQDVSAFIENLQKEVKGKSYTSQKAQYLIGFTYASIGDYSKAYDEFMKSKDINNKSYLASLSLLNAAVCKDNLDEKDAALDLYNEVAGSDELGLAPIALFNVGRIYYKNNNMELAKATFQQLVDTYPVSEYSNIAKSIINQL